MLANKRSMAQHVIKAKQKQSREKGAGTSLYAGALEIMNNTNQY